MTRNSKGERQMIDPTIFDFAAESADPADLQRANETLLAALSEYRACREAGDIEGFLRLEAQTQRADKMISAEGREKKFFENQHNEIYKIAKAWEEMQDPKKVQEIYGKVVAETGKIRGDVSINRYVNAEIRGVRRLSGNALLPEGYRELNKERIECWMTFQHEHERHIKRAFECLIEGS